MASAHGFYPESHMIFAESLTQPQVPASALRKAPDDVSSQPDIADDSSDTHPYRHEYDLANVHASNEELRGRDAVKRFLQEVSKHKILLNDDTECWLGRLIDGKEAVPLFTLASGSVREDYQLHSGSSDLELDKAEKVPSFDLFYLSIDEKAAREARESGNSDILGVVMVLGRLFVRGAGESRKKYAKWTGYEVLVDAELQLWMVFDKTSTDSEDRSIYPVICTLADPFDQDEHFDIARLCALNEIGGVISLDEVQTSVHQTKIRTEKLMANHRDARLRLITGSAKEKSGGSDEIVKTTISDESHITQDSETTDATDIMEEEITETSGSRKRRRLKP